MLPFGFRGRALSKYCSRRFMYECFMGVMAGVQEVGVFLNVFLNFCSRLRLRYVVRSGAQNDLTTTSLTATDLTIGLFYSGRRGEEQGLQ